MTQLEAPETAAAVEPREPARERGVGAALVVLGLIGLLAAFQLTVEKIHLLENPDAALSCDFNLLVQCQANLTSPQGAVFGFPNPLIGLMAWSVVITIGVALLGGARFPRWFWYGLTVGVAGGLAFAVWLIAQSIFVLATLCPWCMVTWVAMIPTFFVVVLHTLRSGDPSAVQRSAAALFGWIPLITLMGYLAVAVIAQLRLDVLGYF